MESINQAIQAACTELFNVEVESTLTRPAEQFGDYATNVALQLGKQLNKKPLEIADAIAEHIKGKSTYIKMAETAGPGFINITLTDEYLAQQAFDLYIAQPLKDKVVVAEYSDPNPFKVLHAGHLYTTIVGDAIANLLENAGAQVHRLNYGGDVGLHVGKTMWAIIKKINGEKPEQLKIVPNNERLEWLSDRYVEGTESYEKDEEAKIEITRLNKQIYQLHEQNDKSSALAQIYWTCRQWSYEGFDLLYEQLQIKPFEKYIAESDVTDKGLEIVHDGLSKGVFEKSDGAVVFKGEDQGLHTRVFVNSAGLATYETKELGLAATKWLDYHFDLSIIITANDIVEYMKVVLKALSNFYPEVVERSQHLTHGVIKLPGGTKMSSRRGNILRASDVLESAAQANQKATGKQDKKVELGAVKYAFLKQRTGGDIIYDPVESVSLEGNSGPYLQYAHARARSILAKSQTKPSDKFLDIQSGERNLVRKISEYPEVVANAVQELMPHHICTYLYELAQSFNRFYENNRVIDDPRETTRLLLVQAYADTLKKGLGLLNIPAPDKM